MKSTRGMLKSAGNPFSGRALAPAGQTGLLYSPHDPGVDVGDHRVLLEPDRRLYGAGLLRAGRLFRGRGLYGRDPAYQTGTLPLVGDGSGGLDGRPAGPVHRLPLFPAAGALFRPGHPGLRGDPAPDRQQLGGFYRRHGRHPDHPDLFQQAALLLSWFWDWRPSAWGSSPW